MKNIGPKSSEWLASIGVHSLEDVARLGVVETYRRVRTAYPEKVTLNMLWVCKPRFWESCGLNCRKTSKIN